MATAQPSSAFGRVAQASASRHRCGTCRSSTRSPGRRQRSRARPTSADASISGRYPGVLPGPTVGPGDGVVVTTERRTQRHRRRYPRPTDATGCLMTTRPGTVARRSLAVSYSPTAPIQLSCMVSKMIPFDVCWYLPPMRRGPATRPA